MGGGKGGGGTSTQYSGINIPPEVLARYKVATDRAETTSQQPWQNYTGSFVAPVNETQQAGYGTMMAGQGYTQAGWEAPNAAIQQGVNTAAPLLNQAGGQYNQAIAQGRAGTQNALSTGQQAFNTASPLTTGALAGAQGYNQIATGLAGAGMQAVDPSQLNLQQFMNPYQQDVIAATMGQLGQQQAQQRNDQRGNMIREGTFGGDRSGIANANMVNQQNLATGSVLSGLNQGNYQQALAAAQQQQGVGLGAAQANRAALQQGAGQMLGIGQQGYQQGMGASQQLFGQGMGLAGLQGQMGQQGFAQGLGGGQALQGLGTAGYGMYSDAAARQAALAGQAFGQNMQTAQGQTGFGTLQQQTQQAQDSAVYNQWLQERGYPFQTSQFYTNAVMGTGPLSGSTAYSGSFTPQPFFSDERLKENVKEVATTDNDQKVISFNYKGDPRTQLGLSAQKVAEDHPEAVGSRDGYLTVDYDKALGRRTHAAVGGGMDPYSGGFAGLGQTANIGSGAPAGGGGFGSLPNIVAMQKASLAGNAPAAIRPPSTAGMAGPGMQGPGNPPPAPVVAPPAAPASGLSPAVAALVAATAEPAPINWADIGQGGGGGPGGTGGAGDAGAGGASSGGDGTGGGTGGTYAEGGRAGFAGEYGSGAVEGERAGLGGLQGGLLGGGMGGLSDVLKAQLAMYGTAPWAKNPQGTGNAGVLNISPAKASQMIKPPEMKAPAAEKSVSSQAKGVVDEASDWIDKGEKAWKAGKEGLYGRAPKGAPGDKDYVPGTGGLLGRGGERTDDGWWDQIWGTREEYGPPAPSAAGGRRGYEDAGEVAPYDDTSILDPKLFAVRDASKVLEPPDPKGEKGAAGQKKDPTAGNVLKAAGMLGSLIPGAGPFIGAGLGAASMFVKRGGRTYAEGGEVNDNQPGLAPAADAVEQDNVHYGIFSRSQGHKMIGRATTLSGARRVRTQRDDAFGGSDHFIKPISVNRSKRWAGGRAGFEDAGAVFADAGDLYARPDETIGSISLEKPEEIERERMRAEILKGMQRGADAPRPALDGALASLTPDARTASDAPPARPGGFSEAVQLAQAGSNPPAVTGPAVAAPPAPDPLANSVNSATAPAATAPPPPPPPPPPAPTQQPAVPQQASPTTNGGNSFNTGNVKKADGTYHAPRSFDEGVALSVHNASTYPATYNQGRPMTIAQIGARWAPTNDPNDKQGLNKNWPVNVATHYRRAGFDPDQPVDFSNPQQAAAFARAVHIAEHGERNALDIKAYLPGVQMANDPSAIKNILGGSGGVGGAKTGTATASGDPNDPAGMSVPAGLGSANTNTNTSFTGAKNGDWWDRNESWTLPLLSGVAGMLASDKRTLPGAFGEGAFKGLEQYMTRGQRQQQIGIQEQQSRTAQANAVAEQYRQTQTRLAADPTNPALKALAAKQLAYMDRLLGGTGMMPNKMFRDGGQFGDPNFEKLIESENPAAHWRRYLITGKAEDLQMANAALGNLRKIGKGAGKDGGTVDFTYLSTAAAETEANTQSTIADQDLRRRLGTPYSAEATAAANARVKAIDDAINAIPEGSRTPADQTYIESLRRERADIVRVFLTQGRASGGRIYRSARHAYALDGAVVDEEPEVQLAQADKPWNAKPQVSDPARLAPPPEPPPTLGRPTMSRADVHNSEDAARYLRENGRFITRGEAEQMNALQQQLLARERESQVRSAADPNDPTKTIVQEVPGAAAARAEKERQQAIYASNNKIKEDIHQQYQQGQQADQLAKTLKSTLFTQDLDANGQPVFDAHGKPKLSPTTKMGKYAESSGSIIAGLQFLGVPPEEIKKITGVDLSKVEESKKLAFALQGVAAANSTSSTGQGAFLAAQEGSPNVNLTQETIQAMVDLIEKKAGVQMRLSEALKDKDGRPIPYTEDWRDHVQTWQSQPQNRWHTPLAATPPQQAAPTLQGATPQSTRKPGETQTINGITYEWSGTGWKRMP